MENKNDNKADEQKTVAPLPACVTEYIERVIRKMGYRRKVRREVQRELTDHFEDALAETKGDAERLRLAEELINQFGDARLLAKLIRRGKKRCRPVWQKALIQTAKVMGVIFLYTAIRAAFLATGTPNINTNYVDWLNNLAAVHQPGAENARTDFDQAGKLCPEIPEEIKNDDNFEKFSDAQKAALAKWLADCQPAFAALRQGVEKGNYWPVYTEPNQTTLQNPLIMLIQTDLATQVINTAIEYIRVAQAMNWQIRYEAYQGKTEAALNDCLILQKFAMLLQGKGLLIEQLIGQGNEKRAQRDVFMLLNQQNITARELRKFYSQLQDVFEHAGAIVDLQAEKAYHYDMVQRSFTDDGQGNGRMLKIGFPLVVNSVPKAFLGFFFWDFPDRKEVTASIDNYLQQVGELLQKSPWQQKQDGDREVWKEIGNKILLLHVASPAYEQLGGLIWRLKAERQALLTVLSILLYHQDQNQYPAALADLVTSGYLKQLPADPYSDKPLIYRLTGQGFILYSVGADFTDDGGVEKEDNPSGSKEESGDWVFWPVQD